LPNRNDNKYSPATGYPGDIGGLGAFELLTKTVSAPDSELNALHEFFQDAVVGVMTVGRGGRKRERLQMDLERSP